MNRKAFILLLFFYSLISASNNIAADENKGKTGFGLQPGIIQPKSDPKNLTRRIMSATRYKLTPGDTYEFVITIEETERYPLLLSDDYLLDIPFLGTIDVRGMYFSDLKKMIVQRIKAKVPVQFVDFMLTSPALFDVFIYGGITNPGIATVNPLSRISDAILLGGGLVKGASFRNIELVRNFSKRTLDLSKFASQADLSQNPLLEPGDKIYIPPAECLVEISGKVKYPGIYELLPGETLGDLLNYSGGVTRDADRNKMKIARIGEERKPVILTVNIEQAGVLELRNGDKISLSSVLDNIEMITLDAALYGSPTTGDKPVKIPDRNITVSLPFVPGMTLLDVLTQMGGPTPLVNPERSYIRRNATGERITLDLMDLWETRSPNLDIPLMPGDLIVIPMKRLQVVVAGEVNNSGSFPYANGYKVYDYILAAGGISVETGDQNSIFFVDEIGNRERTRLDADVEPGTLIYVGKNTWTITQKALTNILIITGFAGALIILANNIFDLANQFK